MITFMTIKTELDTYTIDYKTDNNQYAILERNIRFDYLEGVLQWINAREKELITLSN